jgi:small-conductance mechanosensitive channel
MEPIAAWIAQHLNATAVLATVMVLIVAVLAILVLNRLARRWLGIAGARLNLPHLPVPAITRIIAAAVWVIAAMVILDIWGISLGGLWTLLVSVAAIIGVGFLATWAMISNVTASVLIAVLRPFRLGQTVELLPEKLRGRVVDRDLMFTTLREDNGSVLQVPNNLFFQKVFRVEGDGSQPIGALERDETSAAQPPLPRE